MPMARFARRIGAGITLPAGFILLSLSFVCVAIFAPLTPSNDWQRLLPAAGMVILLTLGKMLVVPVGMDLVPCFAGKRSLGAHYGALASVGGVAVLAGNFLLGNQLDLALTPSAEAAVPWMMMAAFPLCSAIVMAVICRKKKH